MRQSQPFPPTRGTDDPDDTGGPSASIVPANPRASTVNIPTRGALYEDVVMTPSPFVCDAL